MLVDAGIVKVCATAKDYQSRKPYSSITTLTQKPLVSKSALLHGAGSQPAEFPRGDKSVAGFTKPATGCFYARSPTGYNSLHAKSYRVVWMSLHPRLGTGFAVATIRCETVDCFPQADFGDRKISRYRVIENRLGNILGSRICLKQKHRLANILEHLHDRI